MLKHQKNHYNFTSRFYPLFEKRLIYIEIPVDTIVNQAARATIKNIPQAVQDILAQAVKLTGVNDFSIGNVGSKAFTSAREAAANAVRGLGTDATEEAARRVAQEAAQKAAQAEFQVARNAAQQVITREAERLAAEAAARKAAEVAARQGAQGVARAAAGQVPRALGATAVRGLLPAAAESGSTALATTGAEVGGTEIAAGAAGAGAGTIVALALVDVVAIGAAAYEGYQLYQETKGGRWEGRNTINERAAREAARRYDASTIDNDVDEAKKLENNSAIRGMSKVVRDASSNLLSECSTYDVEHFQGNHERVAKLVTYSESVRNRLKGAVDGAANKNTPEYREAVVALAAIEKALAVAAITLEKDKAADPQSKDYKEAYEAKEQAIFERVKGNYVAALDKISDALKGVTNPAKAALEAKIATIKAKLPAIKSQAQFNSELKADYDAAQKEASDILLKDDTKIDKNNAIEIVQRFLNANLPPECLNNPDFVQRIYGMALAKASEGMTVKQFNENMRKAFTNGQFTLKGMIPSSDYFATDKDSQDRPRICGYLWDPMTCGYIVGLADRAKNHPVLGSSYKKYTDEMQKMIQDQGFQAGANKAFTDGGQPAFLNYVTQELAKRNLQSPEAYFHYEPKPEEPAKPATPGTKPVTGPGGAPGKGPGRTPAQGVGGNKPPEKAPERLDWEHYQAAVKGAADSAIANFKATFSNIPEAERKAQLDAAVKSAVNQFQNKNPGTMTAQNINVSEGIIVSVNYQGTYGMTSNTDAFIHRLVAAEEAKKKEKPAEQPKKMERSDMTKIFGACSAAYSQAGDRINNIQKAVQALNLTGKSGNVAYPNGEPGSYAIRINNGNVTVTEIKSKA